jgi:predicted dehydrogenase
MKQKPLRVGLVGCGAVAQRRHIPALRQSKGAHIVALCDAREDLAKRVAKNFNIHRHYTDLSEMLGREELNLVDICTPPRTHATLSVQAMEAGCHVLVEKPMSIGCTEADDMIRASEKNRVKLCVVHNQLFHPVMMKAISMVREGLIGDLTGVSLRQAPPRDKDKLMNKDHWIHKLPGGLFSEQLPHPIYLATAFLSNLEPVAVHTRKLSSYDWVTADELRIILEGEKGIATVTVSYNWPKATATVDVFGTNKNLHVNLYSSVLVTYGVGGDSRLWRALDNLSQSYQQLACTASTAAKTLLGKYRSGHGMLIQRFIQAVRDDSRVPVTGEEGKEVVRVLEKINSRIEGARISSSVSVV